MLCYAKSLQLCPTLCDPIDGSPPGFPVPGILQARTLECVAISFSNVWKWKVKGKSLSRVRLLATPWIAAYQAPPSMGFSKQEYWSGVPLPSPIQVILLAIWQLLPYQCFWRPMKWRKPTSQKKKNQHGVDGRNETRLPYRYCALGGHRRTSRAQRILSTCWICSLCEHSSSCIPLPMHFSTHYTSINSLLKKRQKFLTIVNRFSRCMRFICTKQY